MMRYSNIGRLMAQSRYIVDHRKPVVKMPSKVPPKYIYEVTYHPAAEPGIDLGFPDHQHQNPFEAEGGNRYEQFRYRYVGQWWEGGFPFKLFMYFCPVLIGIGLMNQDADNIETQNPSRSTIKHADIGYLVSPPSINNR